jgi:hypothetical protein
LKAEGYIVLTNIFRKEKKRWLGRCDELGTSVFGRSLPETEKILDEAICLHLNTLDDIGERERFFKENNIRFHNGKPRDNIEVSIPVEQDVFIQPHIQRIPVLSHS